jgi:cysteinyl-tRNA synthetase
VKLYNTLSRQIETIQPQQPPNVTVYTCGPTVYDYPHVGNWFTFIRYDFLIRTLLSAGWQPQWVLNITDVGHLVSDADEGEDKLEKGAKREGKTAWDVAAFYTDYFLKGLARLNMSKPQYLPKATDHIPEQIELIKQLEAAGFTYTIDDGVYFETSKFPRYADFASLDIDEQQASARIEHNPQKHSTSDFALWKFSPSTQKRDMEWPSPWGTGFPGWHIECSAMGMKYLGETIDIHAGGIDHVPVHHTNEIAQSEAVTGKPLSHYWMHANHISLEGEKISKSLGNTITLEDIEKRGISLEAFRLHVHESHYRSQSKFSWEGLEAAQRRLASLQSMADLRWQPNEKATQTIDFRKEIQTLTSLALDDLNSPALLAELSRIQSSLESSLLPDSSLDAFTTFLKQVDDLLGLTLATREDISDADKQLVKKRQAARQAEQWQESDEIRDQLQEHHLGVRDTPIGPIWYRL